MKNIIFASNPFGWGPTGKLDDVIEALSLITSPQHTRLNFVGQKFCRRLINSQRCHVRIANERSVRDLSRIIKNLENPYVFGSQNRFIIKAAKKIGAPSAFLDGLAWFWKNIPTDHLLADQMFWMNFPGSKGKLPPGRPIKIVSGITSSKHQNLKTKDHKKRPYVLVHLGGGENPLLAGWPQDWLKIIMLSLQGITDQKIIVCGGIKMISYLNNRKLPKNISCRVLDHRQFLKTLAQADRLVTPGGQTATLEAMSLGVPVSFLPSYNLSQAALQFLARQEFAAPLRCDWQDLGLVTPSKKEKQAMQIYQSYAQRVLRKEWWRQEMIDNIRALIMVRADFQGQKKFIQRLGTTGAKEIAQTLKKIWQLQ